MIGFSHPRHAFAADPAKAPSTPALPPNRRLFHCGILCLIFAANPAGAATGFWPAQSLRAFSPATDSALRPVQANAADLHVRDILGPAGEPIPIDIELDRPGKDGPKGQLLIFSGIPDGVRLDPGGDFGQFWAVNSNVLGELTLKAPDGFSGSFAVKVTQTGTSPADPKRSATFIATITEPKNQEISDTVAAVVHAPSAPEPVPATPGQADKATSTSAKTLPNLRDEKLMERATALFSHGDISGARMVFEYLVARGNAQAAIALAGTYDPNTLEPLLIKGLNPDPEKAQFWYKKAEELGSVEARKRSDALARR